MEVERVVGLRDHLHLAHYPLLLLLVLFWRQTAIQPCMGKALNGHQQGLHLRVPSTAIPPNCNWGPGNNGRPGLGQVLVPLRLAAHISISAIHFVPLLRGAKHFPVAIIAHKGFILADHISPADHPVATTARSLAVLLRLAVLPTQDLWLLIALLPLLLGTIQPTHVPFGPLLTLVAARLSVLKVLVDDRLAAAHVQWDNLPQTTTGSGLLAEGELGTDLGLSCNI
mmetsp:Transcript_92577/g.160482  ORF Transcript_92577/g.160482 Transcript_92577/m.160482 type:complete len:226 (+) Transcript_92577:585-1262(+)